MKEISLKTIQADTYEIAAWLTVMLTVLLGYKYIKDIIEFVLLKLYEFFIQRRF